MRANAMEFPLSAASAFLGSTPALLNGHEIVRAPKMLRARADANFMAAQQRLAINVATRRLGPWLTAV